MKTTLSLICTWLMFNVAFAQELPLTISNLEVKYNGETMKVNAPVERTIIEDQKSEVLVYEKDGHKYMTRFEYFRSNNRVKMTAKNFVEKPNGDRIYGKTKKYVHFIKVDVPGQFEQQMSEQIVIDKKQLTRMTASYKYTIKYAYN